VLHAFKEPLDEPRVSQAMPISFFLFPWPFPHFRRGSFSFRVLPAWHRDFLTANRRGREQRRRLNCRRSIEASLRRCEQDRRYRDRVEILFSFELSANRENFKVVLSDKLALDCERSLKGESESYRVLRAY